MRTLLVVALLLASTAIAAAQATPEQLERYRQFQKRLNASVQTRLGEGISLTARSISSLPDYIQARNDVRLTWDGTTITTTSVYIDLVRREVHLPDGNVLKLPPKQ